MAAVIGLIALPASAGAQGASGATQAVALFEEARQALERKQYHIACPAFLRSYELDPAKVGVLYALAECYAEAGKIASAVARYQEYEQAASALPPAAREKHLPRLERAKAQQAALAPSVPKVALLMSGPGASGARVVLDGNELQGVSPKAPHRIDPGEHRVTVTSLEGVRVERVFTVRQGEKASIKLEITAKPPAASVPAPRPPPSSAAGPKPKPALGSEMSGRRIAAYSAFGIGAAGVIVMGITGGVVLANQSAVHDTCPADLGDGRGGCKTQDDADRANQMHTLGMVSTISMVAGLVGGVVGLSLLLTEPKKVERAGAPRWVALGPVSIHRNGVVVGAVAGW
jgi:hypothetical protein